MGGEWERGERGVGREERGEGRRGAHSVGEIMGLKIERLWDTIIE